ncbi:MAG: hypothetical protein H6Q69_3242 [Firmicutes bacterium]|nr:hypothetical protein [Bacillota bacterium]
MNPGNAMNVVVSNEIIPTTPTVPLTATSAVPTVATAPVLVITPETLKALQSYTINNFPDIGLPQDIAQIAKDFIANLPPLIPITQTTQKIKSNVIQRHYHIRVLQYTKGFVTKR